MGIKLEQRCVNLIKPFGRLSYQKYPATFKTECASSLFHLMTASRCRRGDLYSALDIYNNVAFRSSATAVDINANEALHLIDQHNQRNIYIDVFSERDTELKFLPARILGYFRRGTSNADVFFLRRLADSLNISVAPDIDSRAVIIRKMQEALENRSNTQNKNQTLVWLRDSSNFLGDSKEALLMSAFYRNVVIPEFVEKGYLSVLRASFKAKDTDSAVYPGRFF